MTTMRVVGECFLWYRLTRVFPDKFHRAVKRLCVCVCVCHLAWTLTCPWTHGCPYWWNMDQWLWISSIHPVEWLFTGDGLVLEMDGSAKLSSGWWSMDIGQYCLVAVIRWTFLIIHWILGDLGPCFPWCIIISGSWTVCRLTFDIFLCAEMSRISSAFCDLCADNHVCCCVVHGCLSAFICCVLQGWHLP